MVKKGSRFAFVICCTVGIMPEVTWLAGSVSVSNPVARMQTTRMHLTAMTASACIAAISIEVQANIPAVARRRCAA